MRRTLFSMILFLLGFIPSLLQAKICGKADIGPTLIDIDVLESGKTVETLHMKGCKADATVLLYQGFCIKPGFLWGEGHGILRAGSIAVGYYLPVTERIKILPNIGVSWSYLRFKVDLEDLQLFDLKERFRSESPFIGMDISFCLTDKWTIIASYQYAWSRTQTKIRSKLLGTVIDDKSHSCGPNYSLGVDYSLNQNWSIIFGVGYNITLSKEKHGLRGKGAKLGIAYYF